MIDDDPGPETAEEPTAARDGEPDADELARRRAAKEENGTSATDRADALDDDDAPEGQQELEVEFEFEEQGRKVTLSNLIARGVPQEFEFKFEGRSTKGRGTLVPYSDPDRLLVVAARAGKVVIDPTYDDDGRILKITTRQIFKARYVMDARTEAAQVAVREASPRPPATAADA